MVANSVRRAFLRFCDPAYLAKLHVGVKLIEWGIVFRAVAMVCVVVYAISIRGTATSSYQTELLHWLVYIPVYVAAYVGWWLFTWPDPGLQPSDPSRRMRYAIRFTIIVALAITLAELIATLAQLRWVGTWMSKAATATAIICWMTRTMVAIRYCVWLAKRDEAQKVVITAQTLTWVVPLLGTVGIAFLGLGPIVAMANYLGLLDEVRSMLSVSRRRRQMELTTPPADPTAAAHPSPPGP